MAIYERRKGMKHFSWALARLHIGFSIFLYPHQEPERGGVCFLLQVKIQRLKEFGFLAQGHTAHKQHSQAGGLWAHDLDTILSSLAKEM